MGGSRIFMGGGGGGGAKDYALAHITSAKAEVQGPLSLESLGF